MLMMAFCCAVIVVAAVAAVDAAKPDVTGGSGEGTVAGGGGGGGGGGCWAAEATRGRSLFEADGFREEKKEEEEEDTDEDGGACGCCCGCDAAGEADVEADALLLAGNPFESPAAASFSSVSFSFLIRRRIISAPSRASSRERACCQERSKASLSVSVSNRKTRRKSCEGSEGAAGADVDAVADATAEGDEMEPFEEVVRSKLCETAVLPSMQRQRPSRCDSSSSNCGSRAKPGATVEFW